MVERLNPKARIVGIRGNVDTRLRKLDEGQYDAIVLAQAGLNRLSIVRPDIRPMPLEAFVSAPAQGALGIQCRKDDPKILPLLQRINHLETARCVRLERAFLASIQGGCNVAAGCCVRKSPQGYHAIAFLDENGFKEAQLFFTSFDGALELLLESLYG